MNRHSGRRRGTRISSLGLVAAVVSGLSLAWAPTALAAPPPTVNSAALAEELERIADATAGFDAATYDDSSSTECQSVASASSERAGAAASGAPDPLVYGTNQVVLRTTRTNAAAAQLVTTALAHIGRADARVGEIERITLPARGEVRIKPVLFVPLISSVPVDVVELSRHLRGHHQTPASPNYLMSPSEPTQWWPDGFPAEIPVGDLTSPRAGGLGGGETIAVYDTGMVNPAQSNNPPNLSRLTPGDVETLDADGDLVVDAYFAGHLTAIAGTLNVIAPSATVKAVRITEQQTGVATDVSAARRMATTLRSTNPALWPALIVNAFGTQACLLDPSDPDVDMVPLGLEAVAEAVDLHDRSLVVASAGNRGTDQRFYPAAFSTTLPSAVLAVGALDTTADVDQSPWSSPSRTGRRASFSNFGPWVTAWAPGVGLPTHHIDGLGFEPGQTNVIDGAARVNGTSFAGPVVAGLIAEQMARTGADADAAWAAIAKKGVKCTVTNGSGVAVALTALSSTAVTPPSAPRKATDC